MSFLRKSDEESINLDASIITLAKHYKENEFSVSIFLSSYSSSKDEVLRKWLLEHMFSLGLTNIGVERWDLDWA